MNHLLVRLRDKDPEIRALILVKLKKDNVPIANFKLEETYKLLYDGLKSRYEAVTNSCLDYLKDNFNNFQSDSDCKQENIIPNLSMDLENIARRKKKSSLLENKDHLFRDMRVKLLNFSETFVIENALLFP